MLRLPLSHVRAGRYRTRTAAEPTATTTSAASGGRARSWWGRGQRYASKAQRMLGAATRLPAAETGRRGWGRVLIFQGPAKGLRKNQQTQLVKAAHLSYSFRRNVYQESSACRSTICTASVGRDRTRTRRLCGFRLAKFTLSGVFFPWRV